MLVRVFQIVLILACCRPQVLDEVCGYVGVKIVESICNSLLVSKDIAVFVQVYFRAILVRFVMYNLIYAFPYFFRVVQIFFKVSLKKSLFRNKEEFFQVFFLGFVSRRLPSPYCFISISRQIV